MNAAHLFGVDEDRGVLRAGMMADIIATPENPLENIKSGLLQNTATERTRP